MRAKRADGGVIKQLIALCLFQPLSHGLRRASSPCGEPFGLCNTAPKLSPLAGDSSRARPVDDKARGESGGIGSVASGSKARRPYSNQRSWHEVPKGEWLKEAKCREVFPLSLFTIVHRQLPRKRWRLLAVPPHAKKSPIGGSFHYLLIFISSRSRCSCRGRTGPRRGHSPRAGSCCRNSLGNSSRSSSRSRGRSPWGRCWSGTW